MTGNRGKIRSTVWTWGLLLLAFSAACQKKRSPEFIQGDGEYIYRISDFNGKSYTLETGEVTGPGMVTDADLLEGSGETELLRSFPSVAFHADIELAEVSHDDLNQLFLFARPETVAKYRLKLGFTEKHLVVYKLAQKADIPSNELTYALPGENGEFQVPLYGYPLKKYVVEYVLDDRGKPTKQKKTISKDFLAESTHFSVDTSSVKVFSSEEKKNLLPTKFFDEGNEWFYEVSIVDGPLSTQLGAQLGAGKVRFTRTSNSLIAVDLNIPDEAKSLAGEKLQRVIEMPVRWADFELLQTGDDAMLKELLLDEQDAGADDWQKREYALLDLKRLNNLTDANTNGVRVTRLEVNENYFSVTLAYADLQGIALHYSFARSARTVPGQIYPVEDQRKYGFWTAIRNFYLGSLTSTEKNFAQNTFLSRMYPNEDNVIEVYLTENTPDIPVFIDAIEKAMEAWDRTFVEAARGTAYEANPIRVKLNKTRKVKNGDVRYNKVSFYDFNINVGGLLGYGPSVTDERSGEVFSSTNHIYLRTYREGVYTDLKNYIKAKLGFYDNKSLAGIEYPNQLLYNTQNIGAFEAFDAVDVDAFASKVGFRRPPSETKTVSTVEKLAEDRPDLSQFRSAALARIQNPAMAEALYTKLQKDAQATFEARRDPRQAMQVRADGCSYKAAVANTFREIENVCGNLRFGDYVRRLKAEKRDASWLEQIDYNTEIFDECALRLLAPTLQSTLVHEFGHNLGMTHNFMGSADDVNFRRDAKGVPLFRSTSVMDYPDRDEDRGFEPGTYDVAAIRYAYYQAVELKDHSQDGKASVVSVAAQKPNDTRSIEEKVPAELRSQLKNYLYCWDLDITVLQIPLQDVRCRRWDRGSNPVQMAYSLIDQFNSMTSMNMSRFEMKSIREEGFVGSVFQSVLLPLQSIYHQYRYKLYQVTKSQNDPYLFKAEARNYDKFIADHVGDKTLADLPKDPQALEAYVEQLPELQQYKLASDVIFKFLKQLVFVQDRYCTVWADKALIDALPFARLREDIFTLSRVSINSCSEVMPYFNLYRKEASLAGAAETDLNYELKKYLGSFAEAAWAVPVSVKDFGNPFATVSYSANDEELDVKAPLVLGTSGIRVDAFFVLTERRITMPILRKEKFFPNFMDDPNYRKELLSEIETRLLNGVDIAKLGVEQAPAAAGQKPRYLQRFAIERSYLEGLYANLVASLYADGEDSFARTKDLLPDIYSRADFLRIFPDPNSVAYIVDGTGRYFVAERPGTTIHRMITTYRGVRRSIALTTTYDSIARERQRAIQAAARVARGFFEIAGQQPELVANDLKGLAVLEASKILSQKFLVTPPGASSTDAATSLNPSSDYVAELVKKASELINVAVANKLKVDASTISSVLVDLTGMQPLEERAPDEVIAELIEDGEESFTPVIYALIESVLASRSPDETALPELNDDKLATLALQAYEKVLKDFASVKLSSDGLSERSAQEGILRGVILNP